MKTMNPPLIAIALAAGLVGCSMSPSTGSAPALADVRGMKPCPASGGDQQPVFIELVLRGGVPEARQKDCSVKSGADVTWVAEFDFEIVFKGAAPLADGGREPLLSAQAYGHHEKTKKMVGSPGTYPYGIKANGHVVDPAIIIRPN